MTSAEPLTADRFRELAAQVGEHADRRYRSRRTGETVEPLPAETLEEFHAAAEQHLSGDHKLALRRLSHWSTMISAPALTAPSDLRSLGMTARRMLRAVNDLARLGLVRKDRLTVHSWTAARRPYVTHYGLLDHAVSLRDAIGRAIVTGPDTMQQLYGPPVAPSC